MMGKRYKRNEIECGIVEIITLSYKAGSVVELDLIYMYVEPRMDVSTLPL